LLARFAAIRNYWSEGATFNGFPIVIFTGGEALLYKSRNDGKAVNLFHVLDALNKIVPEAKMIVKTSGFRAGNAFQRTLFDTITKSFSFPTLEWRIGWNIYQDSEDRALDRFVCTMSRILTHQRMASVDTIYDRTNVRNTCVVLQEGLRRIGVDVQEDMLLRFVLNDPNMHRRLTIKIGSYTIVLDLGPSYAPNSAAGVHEFYSEPSSECDTIDGGTSSLYYDTDMGLIHCNDSFVDARIPSRPYTGQSIAEDLAFLNDRFDKLRHFLARSHTQFESRKDRCFFCTKFIMTNVGEDEQRAVQYGTTFADSAQ
jgi:hypothetical protein